MENDENPNHKMGLNQALYSQTVSALPSGTENRRIPTSYYGDASWTNVPRSHIVKSSDWKQGPAAKFQQPDQALQTQQSHSTQDVQQQQRRPKAIQPDHETAIQIPLQDSQNLTEIQQQAEIQHQQLIRSSAPSSIELPPVPLFSNEGAPSIQKPRQDVQLQEQTQKWGLMKMGDSMVNATPQQKQQALQELEQRSKVARQAEKNHQPHLSRQNVPSRIELPPSIISFEEAKRHENDRHAQMVKWNADFEQHGRHETMRMHSLTPQQARDLEQAQMKLLKNSTSSGGLTAVFSSQPKQLQLNDELLFPVAQHASWQTKSRPHDSKEPQTPYLQQKHNQLTSFSGLPSQQEPNAARSNNTKKSHPIPNAPQNQPSHQSRQKSIPLPSSLPLSLTQQEQVHQSQRSSKVRHSVAQSSGALPPLVPQFSRQQQQWGQDLFEIPGDTLQARENSNIAQTVNTCSQVATSFSGHPQPDGQALPSQAGGFAGHLEQLRPGSFQSPQGEDIELLTKSPPRIQARELSSFQSQANSNPYPTRPQLTAAEEQQALRDLFAAQEALDKAKQDKIDLTKRLEEIEKAMLFKITEMQAEAKGRKKRLPNMMKDLIDYSTLMNAGGYGYGIPGELDWEDSDIEMSMSGGEKCDGSSVNYGGRKEATQASVGIVPNSNEDKEGQDGPPPKRGRGRPRVRPLGSLKKRKN